MPVALVTGYTGFLGRELLAQMSEVGWRFILVGRRPPKTDSDHHYLRLDLNDPDAIAFPQQLPRPDVIIHLASRVWMNSDSERDLFATNVLSTAILAQWAICWGCLVTFASSISVYDANIELVTSCDVPQPSSAYGRSKLVSEQILGSSGVDNCILRFAGIFGSKGPGHLGINTAIEKASAGRRPVLRGDAQGLRNYIYLKDAAAAIAHAANCRLTGVHLVAGRETLSIAEMLQGICDQWLPGMNPERSEGLPGRDLVVEGNFPFTPRYCFDDALRDIAGRPQ